MSTGNSNLRRHLRNYHPQEYDNVVVANKWDFQLSTQVNVASNHSAHNATTRSVPPFSAATFLDHLVRFIVADDQVWFTNLGFVHVLTHLQVYSCC
jgi:hypothetical protein